ncbi:MAG: LysE family transporter [Bacteroidales bacterium]|nr:LysE family transporter [Bacteroidales bacterium]
MELPIIIYGIIIGLMVSIPLGPVGVMCIQRTLNRGRWAGFISGLGAAAADVIFSVFAVFSAKIIIENVEKHQDWFQIVGGVIFLAVGVKIFITNPVVQLKKRQAKKKENSFLWDFLSVFIITITNPVAILLFLIAFSYVGLTIEPNEYSKASAVISGIAIGTSAWWFLLASVVNLFRRKITLRSLWMINKVAGALIVVFVLGSFINMLL